MERDVDRLLMVIDETVEVSGKEANRWLVRMFHELAANGATVANEDDNMHRDVLFRNNPARIAYETFIGVVPHDGQTTYIMWIACVDACMSFIIEDLLRRLKAVGSRGNESHVRNTTYSSLLPFGTAKVEGEFLASSRRSLPTSGQLILQLDAKLQV